MMEERWEVIPQFPELMVSDTGTVRRNYFTELFTNGNYSYRVRKASEIRCVINNHGYPAITYKRKHYRIHRFVATAFVSNPNNHPDVNHKDGDKENNHFTNLEWCTRAENLRHSMANGTHPRPPIAMIGVHPQTGHGLYCRALIETEKYGFIHQCVRKVINGQAAHHRGYIWSRHDPS